MNILTVADIHIHDYSNRTPQEHARLDQTRIVAQNIIEVGKANNCEVIVFAGDVVEKSLIRPYIQARVKEFLDTIMSNFSYGFIINGNHDIDHKDQVQAITDSCLGIMLPSNLYYADQQCAKLGSSICAFSNWKPSFDLSWIPGKADVLFTHATVNYGNGSMVKTQKMDQSKFDLAICGDIHLPAHKGKFVSVGCPQKCKMGDSDQQTGVIYDTEAKTWRHVNLNPHDNLLKFAYTSDLGREGYSHLDNTWYVYQPATINIANGQNQIQVPQWQEIQDLVNAAIQANGLEQVHAEIMTQANNKDIDDVDFCFIPIRFACHNWRSIDDLELFFQNGDKFLVRGQNGSGKSSLFSAIKYALFSDNTSSLKSFMTFGTKECWTEIEFLYQGKTFKIRKSSETKNCGLWVDGVQQKYSSKKDLDADLAIRFPFTQKKYLKLYCFDESNSQLINNLSDEELVNSISKFYKLDRINLYHKIASDALQTIKDSSRQFYERKVLLDRQLADLEGKLLNINLPQNQDLDDLRKQMDYYQDLQRKYNEYTKYLEIGKELAGRVEMLNYQLSKAQGELQDGRPQIGSLMASKTDLENQLLDLQGIDDKYRYYSNQVQIESKKLDLIVESGRRVQGKIDELKENTCPVCHHAMDLDEFNAHRNELLKERDALLGDWNTVNQGLESLKKECKHYRSTNQEIANLKKEISNLQAQISDSERLQEIITEATREIQKAKDKMGLMNSEIPEKVSLPENFIDIVSEIQRSIDAIEVYNQLQFDKQKISNELAEIQANIDVKKRTSEKLEKYVNITSPIGDIYAEIMKRLSKDFSDTQVKYEVKKFTKNTKEHLSLIPQFNVQGHWCNYETCSTGQKTFLDIHFLSKIITGTGFIIMDEFLKSLDPENHDVCLEMLSKIPTSCMLISSHMETVGSFNNHLIRIALDTSGSSKFDII